jgi:alanine dehydrogenase
MTRLLSKNDVANVLTMSDTIGILEQAFTDLSNGKAIMPQRTPIPSSDNNGVALFMPAYLKGMGAFGAKVVTVFKDNLPKYNLPTVLGTIILLDEKTGSPLALIEGGYLTAMRTGAVAGLATKYLARKDAKIHTLFGTGGMARTNAISIDCVRNIEKLILVSLDPVEKKNAFKKSLEEIVKCKIELANNSKDAVEQADIVTLITNSKDPIIDGGWIKPGTHINGIGSHAPSMRELDTKTVVKSKIVCDLIEACKPEAGDFIIPVENGDWNWDKVYASLGDVVTGKISGRENEKEITLFKSVGLAIQDLSTAFHVYKKALEMNVGMEFNF